MNNLPPINDMKRAWSDNKEILYRIKSGFDFDFKRGSVMEIIYTVEKVPFAKIVEGYEWGTQKLYKVDDIEWTKLDVNSLNKEEQESLQEDERLNIAMEDEERAAK